MPYEPDREVVIIISETLQRWTNGLVRAGLHRVTRLRDMEGAEVLE